MSARVISSPASLSPSCAHGRRERRGATAAAAGAMPEPMRTSSPTACCSTASSSHSRRNFDRLSAAFRPAARRPSLVATRALAPDAPPDWTLDQIAGLVFGLGMLASFLLAYKVDDAVARQQRRDLGICEACGGLNEKGSCREKRCPRQ